MTNQADVVIVGGGGVGSSVAFFLRELGFSGSVCVIEKDPTYAFATTPRANAGIRQQFSTPVCVRMSQFGFSFFDDIRERFGDEGDIRLNKRGYLFLADKALEAEHRTRYETFIREGADVAWLTPEDLSGRFPWLNVEDLAGATLGLSGEGWFDPHLLLQFLRRQASGLGARYVHDEVVSIGRSGDRVASLTTAKGDTWTFGTLVNAAGPGAGVVAGMAGIHLPVEPRKRSSFAFKAPVDGSAMPFMMDSTGVAVRPERDTFLCGAPDPVGDADLHPGTDFEPDHSLFEDVIWPVLAHRIPKMENLRLLRGWAGHYDMNLFDHNGVIGRHPEVGNFYFANGFSGHGVMHAPATGRGVAELIIHGRYASIDLGPLGYERIAENRPVTESMFY